MKDNFDKILDKASKQIICSFKPLSLGNGFYHEASTNRFFQDREGVLIPIKTLEPKSLEPYLIN